MSSHPNLNSMTTGRRLVFSATPPGVSLEAFDLPEPGPHEVRVQHTRTHLSIGTEMNFFRGGPAAYAPTALSDKSHIGYMAAGVIAAVGGEVKKYNLGDRVASSSHHGSQSLIDTQRPGIINVIPSQVSDDEAGFLALGDVALHAVRRAELQIGESVIVYGAGMVGQLVIQFARLSGAHPIIAVDPHAPRLALAKQSGATHVIDALVEDLKSQILNLTSQSGVEKSFMCASVPEVLPQALICAADRGKVMLTGSPSGAASIPLRADLLRKELTILGTYESHMNVAHPYWPWTRDRNRDTYLRLVADRQLHLDHLITHVIPAAAAPAIYQQLLESSSASEHLGVVFDWSNG